MIIGYPDSQAPTGQGGGCAMELNENAELGSGQVEDFRGSGGGGGFGGGGGGIPIPLPVGGGRIGLIITIVIVLGMVCLGGAFGTNILGGSSGDQQADNTSLEQRCAKSNPNRFQDVDCRNWLYVTSIQAFWTDALPKYFGQQYQQVSTRFFANSVNTGCGQADSGVGPFYCPADRHVYIDLTFYNELSNRFGASGEFAAPYVLAHEYGHHVQTLLGTEARARQGDQSGPNSAAVRLELQADCYAGAWANHATETKDPNGQALFKSISAQDIQEAVETAEAIGDDAIQRQGGGQVNPDSFTHGTSAQRKQWFTSGYNTGDPTKCDTFSASRL
jgi:predicted metalloprotease